MDILKMCLGGFGGARIKVVISGKYENLNKITKI